MKIKVFTAFSGYDSQCMALDMLKQEYESFDYELVGWSEIDSNAIKLHNLFYPQWADRNFGDVIKIDWEQVPDFDLFTYSFPCQSISTAGLQHGLTEGSGTRSSLLWECKKAISIKHPKICLMENVKALTGKKFMPQFQLWLDFLESEGYTNFWQVMNAKNYEIPQNRERVFCVSVLNCEKPYVFPAPIPLDKCLGDMLDDEDTIPRNYYIDEAKVEQFVKVNEKKLHEVMASDSPLPTSMESANACEGGGDGTYSDPKWIKIEVD